MRNSSRITRAPRHARLHLEQLESRQLLSVSIAGTMVSSFQTSSGSAEFVIDNPQANLHTLIHVQFGRDIDSAQSAPLDHLQLSVDFFRLDNNLYQGTLGTTSLGSNYMVTTSSSASSLRLAGDFGIDGSAFGVTFAHAALSLDVAWTRLSIDQHVETVGLEVGDGFRDLTVSLEDVGKANAVGTFSWSQGSTQILSSLPSAPLTVNAKSALLVSSYQQTNALPEFLSLKTLILELSPPDAAPRNSKVAVHSTQAATTNLIFNVGDPNSGIRISQGQDYFTNPQVIPGSAYIAFSRGDGDFGGFASSGMSLSPDGSSADAKGGSTGVFFDSGGNFQSVPFNLDLHWQADPTSAVLTFIRTTTTTPSTITTEFAQQTDYDAIVTGTASFTMDGALPTVVANGQLSQFRSVTITTPAPVKGQIVVMPDATVISKPDWQNMVVKPWQTSVNVANANDFLGGKGKGKNLVVALRHAVRSQFACLPRNRGLN